jgi:outer membrane protein assembly factor BamB
MKTSTTMLRATIGALLALAAGWPALPAQAARPIDALVPQQLAQRYGLIRAWTARIELDPSRGRLTHLALDSGLLLAQTDQGAVHVLDAETRRSLWVARVGRAGKTTTAPAANKQYVAATNGGMLYLFERETGRKLWEKKLASVPSAGPAIGRGRVYVPLGTGVLTTFRLPTGHTDESPAEQTFKDYPLNYRGTGLADAPPVVTRGSVFWGTDAGNIYAVNPDNLKAQFRVKTRAAVTARVTFRVPYVYACSRDGFVYCIRDEKGHIRWRFSVGNPIVNQPMVTGDGVYVIPEIGGLYKLDPDTGDEIWLAPGADQFIAASPTRLYTADQAGRMLVFDSRTGGRIGWLPTESSALKVFNRENDRVYLATATGLIQCLRETQLTEPAWHTNTPAASADEDEDAPDAEKKPSDEKPATDEPDPFDEANPPADADE